VYRYFAVVIADQAKHLEAQKYQEDKGIHLMLTYLQEFFFVHNDK
jgi:hypothetical protein